MRASWCSRTGMTMIRAIPLLSGLLLALLLALAGCDRTDPYLREGVWHPNGANDANLRAMIAVPSDLATATPAGPADGGLAAEALDRLRHDRVRSLSDTSASSAPASGAAPTPAAAAPASGASN